MQNRIKQERHKKGITQAELASKTGISKQSISFYERGERNPKIETWQALAKYFHVPVAYLQGVDDSRTPNSYNVLYESFYNKYKKDPSVDEYLARIYSNLDARYNSFALDNLAKLIININNGNKKEISKFIARLSKLNFNDINVFTDDLYKLVKEFVFLALDASKNENSKKIYLNIADKLINYGDLDINIDEIKKHL